MSRLMVDAFLLLGARDRLSARIISHPGLYVMVMSYPCSLSSMVSSLGGAAVKFLSFVKTWLIVRCDFPKRGLQKGV